MAEVRLYRAGDVGSLLSTWNLSLPRDPVDLEGLVAQVLCDPNMEPAGLPVACDPSGDVVAFAYATVRRLPPGPGAAVDAKLGWVNAFGVRPEWRRRGLGRACLESAMGYLARQGCQTIRLGAFAPRYIAPGVDLEAYPEVEPFLTALGFTQGAELVSMQASLLHFGMPDDVLEAERALNAAGVVIEPLAADWLVDLVTFIREHFQAGSAQVIQDAITHGGDMRQIFIAREQASVVGYAMYGLYDGNPERFGPFGVRADQRRRNVGKVLLYRCMQAMQARGLRAIWFKSTGEMSPAGHLYRRAGFTTVRRFRTYTKPIAGYRL